MFVHASRIQKQFEYLSRAGIALAPLYRQLGFDPEARFAPGKQFDLKQYQQVLDYALHQTGNPDYGLDLGREPQLGGTIGTMSASCANLREAFIQGCKFLKLQGDFALLQFLDDPEYPKITYTLPDSWLLESPQTAKVEIDAMFSFLNTILRINSNNNLKARKIKFSFARPEHVATYHDIFGIAPAFNADENAMVFDQAALRIPMKAFNPETFQLLAQYLQSQLDRMGQQEKHTEKVKRILYASFKYQFPDIESVADKLNLSPRTLQRKLSDEQTTFKNILQETRFGIARELLRQRTLTVSEISYMLGYADLGNFSRSFKKYVGVSPQAYRAGQQV